MKKNVPINIFIIYNEDYWFITRTIKEKPRLKKGFKLYRKICKCFNIIDAIDIQNLIIKKNINNGCINDITKIGRGKKIKDNSLINELSKYNIKLSKNEKSNFTLTKKNNLICSCGNKFKATINEIRNLKKCNQCNKEKELIKANEILSGFLTTYNINKNIKITIKNEYKLTTFIRNKNLIYSKIIKKHCPENLKKFLANKDIPINILEQIKNLLTKNSISETQKIIQIINNFKISKKKLGMIKKNQ